MNLPNRWRVFAHRLPIALLAVLAMLVALVTTASANLAGSTFEGNDGNLVVNTAGNTDWSNAPNRVTGVDQPSGSADNAFGQGTKEDSPNVTVVDGSIPPNKNDLSRFYIGSEFTGGSNFVYLGWERAVNIGSANLDFELNQNPTAGFTGTTTGPVTLNRTAGDILITYDFGGSGTPTLGLLKWVTSGSTAQCFSANSLPCWGNRVNLSAAGFAEGAVNAGTVSEPIAGGSLTAGLFGEAAVNLTAAGVFPSGTCTAFGSTFLKSRSSTSFTAEVKDFVAPQPINISNCGTIKIHKVTENGDGTFGYTTTGGLSPASFTLSNGGLRTYSSVLAGNYSVTESTLPAGWSLKSLACTATGSGTGVTPSGATASIVMAGGGVVDCVYTNHANFHPSITTTLSANPVPAGTAVHDSSALSGAGATAGGTVTYTVYADSGCSALYAAAGTKTVTNGSVPDSDSVTFSSAGTFYWQAAYSGDANNNPATSTCVSETLVVNKLNPTIATTLSAGTVNIGATVHDSATLSGATGNAGGTATYTVYSDNSCSALYASAGTKTVTNGSVPDSDPVTFSSAGTFYWQVVYSGDANNNGATSTCTSEQVVVQKNPTGMTTAQNLLPNDSSTLSGATATAGGTITFKLFSPADATCSGSAVFSQTDSVSGNGTYTTTNTTVFATDEGTWRWQVSYTGDANNEASTSACGVEQFTIKNS